MDLRLKKERVECFACVLDRTVEDAFTSDAVVPDSLPDVASVLLTDGDFFLWRLDLSSGTAEAEGEWRGSVVYAAESDGAAESFPVSVGVRLRVHDDLIEPELRPFAAFQVTELSAQIMNSRKLRLKARVQLSLRGYRASALELSSGLEDAPEDVFLQSREQPCSLVTAVEEQMFTAGGRTPLRFAPQGGAFLASNSELVTEEVQLAGTRAVLHGSVRTTVLYRAEESAAPVSETVETPFSQLLDLDAAPETGALQCRAQLTSGELHLHEGNDLEAEFHIVAQTVCTRDTTLSCLTDAYSVRDRLELTTETLSLTRTGAMESARASAEVALPCRTQGASVVGVTSRVRAVRMTAEGVSGTADVTVLLSDENGGLSSAHGQAPFACQPPARPSACDVRAETAAVTQTADGVQVRVPLRLELRADTSAQAQQLAAVSRGERNAQYDALPSLTLVPRSACADLWTVAKRYASSEQAITAANPTSEGDPAPDYWIVPRVRAE